MSGVLFVVCVPTANHEHTLLYGCGVGVRTEHNNGGRLKLDVELRNKKSVRNVNVSKIEQHYQKYAPQISKSNKLEDTEYVPMEKILDELLVKLRVEHVVWCGDKNGNYYEVFFPIPAGEPCENCLHCLTQLGIGVKLNSVVSVLPCSVVYSGMKDSNTDEDEMSPEEKSAWNSFVDSVKSKLTVKQVVDGVRSGGDLTFDYIMLILTADCLAALGLVENNAPNIVAAMLVSPLMGPVMSLTFGTIIADRDLQKSGAKSLAVGILISMLFGFIFGLILGTTDMPWGTGDWPTEEMKTRGNSRCLWIGVLWALPSGTGVALALLQGSAGPLIGVAISASLLPPVVNCGIFWALACIWLLYPDIKIPHIKGELYTGNSTYKSIYYDYIPLEFFINGIISALLTVVNVVFIFISAIVMLKIKEVAAPYTSTPDVRRFWERDIRIARQSNRSMYRSAGNKNADYAQEMTSPSDAQESAFEAAVREAVDDETFKKVKRISYAHQNMDELAESFHSASPTRASVHAHSAAINDLTNLDKLISTLLNTSTSTSTSSSASRLQSRSFRHGSRRSRQSSHLALPLPTIMEAGRTTNRSDKNNVTRTISLGTTNPAAHLFDNFTASAQDEEKQSLTKS